jgi:2,3-bisphosphoglycerate-independent phosphoglycerate mutase
MNIGAGRIATQDLPRIDLAIAKGELATNPKLLDLITKIKAKGGQLHIIGLLSDGGVHSHQDHIVALAQIGARAGLGIMVHALLDGRDTPPESAAGYLAAFQAATADHPQVSLATIGGRYFAMDRDKRWDRVAKGYEAIVHGRGAHGANAHEALDAAYAKGETDEFVTPAILGAYAGMQDGDGVLFANFRADRARQFLTALCDPGFDGFDVGRKPDFAGVAGMVEYSTALNAYLPALFQAIDFHDTLGEVVSRAGCRQLRLAETEKFAHVTYFLNGGAEAVFDGEERLMIQSPKVATYDLAPEMSAREVTDQLVTAITSDRFDLIVVNYANGDMVGHTGDLAAAIRAVEALDTSLARVIEALEASGGAMLITADHGNAEMMRDPVTGAPHTAHTTFDVPVILVGAHNSNQLLSNGKLSDVAPTILALMGLEAPAAMTGTSLLHATAGSGGVRAQA